MFDYDYGYSGGLFRGAQIMSGAGIVCLILAIIGGLILLFAFLPEQKEQKYNGFMLWLYKILNFRKMFSMGLLKLLYLISVIYLTLMGFVMLFSVNFLAGLLTLIFGNLVVRIVYEFFILIFSIHDNLSQINHNTAQLVNKPQETDGQNQYQ